MFKNIKLKKALIGAGLGVLGVGTIVGTTWGISEIVSNRQNVDGIEDLTPGTPLIDGVESNENESVHEMPKQITFTRYAKQATSNNTLTVTCTVLPADTFNKKLTWTLQWADGGSHGTVTDYVKMTVNGDTSQCTIQSLKEWINKIKLVVKTTDGSNLSKECTLDYLGRNLVYHGKNLSVSPDTVLSSFYQNNILNNLKVSGGTLQGNIVVDFAYLSINCCDGDSGSMVDAINLMNNDSYYTLRDFVNDNYDLVSKDDSGDGFDSERAMYEFLNGEGSGDLFIKCHLVYNGSTYHTVTGFLWLESVTFNIASELKATSLSLNDTSFIF